MAVCTLLPVVQVQPRRMVCFARIIGGFFPSPKPPKEHFFESRKPHENLPAKTKAHGIQKNVNLAFLLTQKLEQYTCPFLKKGSAIPC